MELKISWYLEREKREEERRGEIFESCAFWAYHNVKNFFTELISFNEFLLKEIKIKCDHDEFFDIDLRSYISKFIINTLKFPL